MLGGLFGGSTGVSAAVADPKERVRIATTSNITLSGEQTLQTVSMLIGDRLLVAGQTLKINNGIYIIQSGAWTRASEMPAGSNAAGNFTHIDEGFYPNKRFVCTNNVVNATVGTDDLVFVIGSGATLTTVLTVTGTIAASTNFSTTSSGANYTHAGDASNILPSAAEFEDAESIQVWLNGVMLNKGSQVTWQSEWSFQIDTIVNNTDEIIILS